MSRCSVRTPVRNEKTPPGCTFIDRRSWLICRVDSGQCGSGPVSAAEMLLIGKARHLGVWLRLQHGGEDAPLGLGFQQAHAAAVQQARDQRGDEHSLARTRKAR